MEALTITRESWSAEAEILIAKAAHDPLVGVATVRGLVESHRAELFVTRLAGKLVFAYVIMVNFCENGTEAVVVASSGVALPGVNLSRVMIPAIEKDFSQCSRIRMTASRPGMERILDHLGYHRQAVIFTKERASNVL